MLPQWLAQPDFIQRDIKGHLIPVSNIAGLSSNLINKLHHNGIDHFFPGESSTAAVVVTVSTEMTVMLVIFSFFVRKTITFKSRIYQYKIF